MKIRFLFKVQFESDADVVTVRDFLSQQPVMLARPATAGQEQPFMLSIKDH